MTTTYEVRPTEPDADIVAYQFATEPDVWDYITETLAYEYGMAATDIVGAMVYGYHNDHATVCDGHVIATVTRVR